MQRVTAEVKRGPMESIVVNVPPWEIAILRAIYGHENVVVHDLEEDNQAVTPRVEYQRLLNKYGPKEGMPTVQEVFGRLEAGNFTSVLKTKVTLEELQQSLDEVIGDSELDAEITDVDDPDKDPVTNEDLQPDYKLDTDGNRYLKVDEIENGIETLIAQFDLPDDLRPGPDDKKRADKLAKLDNIIEAALEQAGIDIEGTRDQKIEALFEHVNAQDNE